MVLCRFNIFYCFLVTISYYLQSASCDQNKLNEWRRNPLYDVKTIDSRNPKDILRPFMKIYKNVNKTVNERHRMKIKHRLELLNQVKDKDAIKHLDRYFMHQMPKYAKTKRSYRRKLVGYKRTTKKDDTKKGRQGQAPGPDAPTEDPTTKTPATQEGEAVAGDTNAELAAGESEATTLANAPYSPNVVLPDPLLPYNLKEQLEAMTKEFTNYNISVEVIGRTASFNDIILIKATSAEALRAGSLRSPSKYIDEAPEKKILFIVQSLSLMDIKLIDALSTVQELKVLLGYYFAHLDKYDIFVMPLANPDGFLEAHNPNARYYNDSTTNGHINILDKNLSMQKGSCRGVNLDRNFDVGSSPETSAIDPCRQDYPGPQPFSEFETQAIREIFHKYNQRMAAYIHVHAGSFMALGYKGDAVLYPKGYTEITSDDDKYIDLRGEIEESLKTAGFKLLTVTVDTLYNWYGKVAGTSVDYAASVYGIPYSMEFVMQAYDIYGHNKVSLTEVWQRVINTTFININKIRTADLYEKK